MRKKQNAENVFSRKDLEQLERKLEEQKMILVKENKKLQSQIYKEIEEANMNKIIYEKNKQISDKKIEQLGLEIERMRVQLLKKVPESDSEDEEELSMLKVNRDVIL